METMSLETAVNEISQAFAVLEVAREDCKSVVDATIQAFQANSAKVPADLKTEAKNIKKLAKAMLKGEKQVAKEEADNMTSLIESLG